MKYIGKNSEPQWFVDWKKNHPGATYDSLSPKIRKKLRASLVEEQHYICCYCECRIDVGTSHNEHFKPKGNSLYRSLQLDYDNIFASCTKEPDGSPEEHCGHKKKSEYDPQLVSPLEPNCSIHFKYNLNGKISPADNRGQLTIGMLKLDSALLDAARKTLIDLFLLKVDPDDLDVEILDHLDKTKTQFGEFYTMIEYLHNTYQL